MTEPREALPSGDPFPSDAAPGNHRVPLVRRLTPGYLESLSFPRAPLARRGYDQNAVDHFVAQVLNELRVSTAEHERLLADLHRVQQENAHYRDYWRNQNSDLPRVATVEATLSVTLATTEAVQVMSEAQRAADAHIAQAQGYAKQMVVTARRQYEEILTEAHQQAERAAEVAARLPASAPAQLAVAEPAAAASDDDVRQWQGRAAYLRTFAQVTQVQLRAVLDGLSKELDRLTELPEVALPPGQLPERPHAPSSRTP